MQPIQSFFALLLAFTFLVLFPQSYQGEELERGKILNGIICQKEPAQSYALYLPSSYTPEKKWPILYALDPGARGKVPLEHFQSAAEKYNYIMIGSNNCRNGPWDPIFTAITAVWNDTNARFSIDDKRVYVTGFSGGSRGASLFPSVIMFPVSGIIGCGAGLAPGLKPENISRTFYYGMIGNHDFNYIEMTTLDKQLDSSDVQHRFLVFAGGHDWPPQKSCKRALSWMEIIGMNNNVRPLDKTLIQEIYTSELREAESLEKSGELSRALSDYKALITAFKAWQDTSSLEAKIEQLIASKEFKNFAKKEKNSSDRELLYNKKHRQVLAQVEQNPPHIRNLNTILSDLDLSQLLKEANENKQNSALAIRVLFGLGIDAFNKGRVYSQKKDSPRAILFLEIAAKTEIKDSIRKQYILYNLACSYALSKKKKKALLNLRLAIKSGFADINRLEKDEELKSIRNSPEFQKILNSLHKK